MSQQRYKKYYSLTDGKSYLLSRSAEGEAKIRSAKDVFDDETQRKRKRMSLKDDDTGILKTLNEAQKALDKFKKQMKQKDAKFKNKLQTKQDEIKDLKQENSELKKKIKDLNRYFESLRRYKMI